MATAVESPLPLLPSDLRFDLGEPIVCAGHALKETLPVALSTKALSLGVSLSGGTLMAAPCLSDGGDGFLEAYRLVHGGQIFKAVCYDPIGRLTLSDFLFLPESKTAAIEMAKVNGLSLVPQEKRRIMDAGTTGLGELISEALRSGATEIHIGIGGSATCDGGLGVLMRLEEEFTGKNLGERYYTAHHHAQEVTPDVSFLRRKLADVKLFAYCDVRNPLLGPEGTAAVFAPQKGATPAEVEELERLLGGFAERVEAALGETYRDKPGAGAAGGVGFALASIGATLCPGASMFCEIVGLRDYLAAGASLITCEGRFDGSSLSGKAPWTAAQLARSYGRRAAIVVGTADLEARLHAENEGITILEFGRDLPPERRSAEAFTRLQERVRRFLTRGR